MAARSAEPEHYHATLGQRMIVRLFDGCSRAQERLYRLALNGKIRFDEMTRFIYALKEIRACLEAVVLIDVQQRLVLLSRDMDNQGFHGPDVIAIPHRLAISGGVD
jgi:hypothetical protein